MSPESCMTKQQTTKLEWDRWQVSKKTFKMQNIRSSSTGKEQNAM